MSLVYDLQYARGALTAASNKINNSIPGAGAVQNATTFTFPSTNSIKCMQIAFTTTTASPSAVPTGMVTTSASKGLISGGGLTDANWSIYNSVNGVVQYEYTSGGSTTASSVTITTNGITNPTSAGVYYAQIRTYSGLNSDICTGLQDYVIVAFAIVNGQVLSVNVDPSLTFTIANLARSVAIGNGATTSIDISTASANTIPMGNVNPAGPNPIAGQSLTVSTNATNGYVVYASYSGTLAFGANTIADHTGTNGTPAVFPAVGTSAFGYQSGSTSLSAGGGGATRFSGGKWAKFEQWGYEVARAATKVSSDATNIGYQVGVNATQEAGTYTTTITYVAVPLY